MHLMKKKEAILNYWETKYCKLIIFCFLILFFLRIIYKDLTLVLVYILILQLSTIFLINREQSLGSFSVKKVFLSVFERGNLRCSG